MVTVFPARPFKRITKIVASPSSPARPKYIVMGTDFYKTDDEFYTPFPAYIPPGEDKLDGYFYRYGHYSSGPSFDFSAEAGPNHFVVGMAYAESGAGIVAGDSLITFGKLNIVPSREDLMVLTDGSFPSTIIPDPDFYWVKATADGPFAGDGDIFNFSGNAGFEPFYQEINGPEVTGLPAELAGFRSGPVFWGHFGCLAVKDPTKSIHAAGNPSVHGDYQAVPIPHGGNITSIWVSGAITAEDFLYDGDPMPAIGYRANRYLHHQETGAVNVYHWAISILFEVPEPPTP